MMEQFKKIALSGFLLSILCFKTYAQDTISREKNIYKITPALAQKLVGDSEQEFVPKKGTSIYSCEVNATTKKVTISYKQENGTITKETYDLKEDKKETVTK
jgi:hypothetical protein